MRDLCTVREEGGKVAVSFALYNNLSTSLR